jgi:hypothetical protein
MNETQIRQRLRDAVGETRVPPDLRNRVEVRLGSSQRMKGGSLMFGLGRTASVVVAVLALLLVAAAVIGIRAWHDNLANSRPASRVVQNPTVNQYQAMVSQDEVYALSKQANACNTLTDDCPTAAPRLAAALQQWLDDLNATRPPSRFIYVDAELRRHVADCIADLKAAVVAYNAKDQKGMDAAIGAGASERDTFMAEVDAIRNSTQASVSVYTSLVRSDPGLTNCVACQTLAGSEQAPCSVDDAFCQNNIVVAIEDIDGLQGNLVRNFAPDALASKDALLQMDVWAADQALVAMDAAWSAHDQAALQAARDAFTKAFTRVVSDLASI